MRCIIFLSATRITVGKTQIIQADNIGRKNIDFSSTIESIAICIRYGIYHGRNVGKLFIAWLLPTIPDFRMCIGIIKNEMMCRIDPAIHEEAVEKTGCRTMDFTNRPMKGYVLIDESGMKSAKDFKYWISLALDFNKRAKASKKKKKK